jgi:hypothetical protein
LATIVLFGLSGCEEKKDALGATAGSGAASAALSVVPAPSIASVVPVASVAPAAPPLPPPATSADAAATCGTKPLPDCPLQAWMRANTAGPATSGDLPALATALDKTAKLAPAGYTTWASIATDGANAARAGDLKAARAACTGCHEQWRAKYRSEMRMRPVPAL